MSNKYQELHRHGEKSHDGSGKPEQAARYARDNGQTALGLTEHGNLNSAIEHFYACRDVNVKGIVGCEMYMQPTRELIKPSKKSVIVIDDDQGTVAPLDHDLTSYTTENRFHLTVLAQNINGYKNLCKMMTRAAQESFYYHPIITLPLLEEYGSDLIYLTGCVSGFVSHAITSGEPELGRQFIEFLRNLSGHVYLEVQPFEAPGQRETNNQLIKWHQTHGYPLVMTSDAHYVKPQNYHSYQTMQRMRKPYADGLLHNFSDRHMHTEDSIIQAWMNFMPGYLDQGEKAVESTSEISDMVDLDFDTTFHMPELPWLSEKPIEALPKLVGNGLVARGKGAYDGSGKRVLDVEYKQRVIHELKIIQDRDFASYLLLCSDLVTWARSQGISICARGSGCNSVVTWALGMHDVDPVKYNLIFERFISRASQTIPDIDLDVQADRREEVVNHLVDQYPGQVAQICTYGLYKQKSIILAMNKIVPMDVIEKQVFKEQMLLYPDVQPTPGLKHQMLLDSDLQELNTIYGVVDDYCEIYGQVSFIGTHAAGVVITEGPITEYLALNRIGTGSDSRYVVSADMNQLARLNKLKVDLLGLTDWEILSRAEEDAGFVYGREYDSEFLHDTLLKDQGMLQAFAQGNTRGIPQSERWTPKKLYRQIKPKDVTDLAIVSACNRPQPLQEGTFQQILDGRAGKGNSHKFYHDICSATGGAILFQEQVRQICTDLARLDEYQADRVLKLLKRYHENDQELEDLFVSGLVDFSVCSEQEARSLWEQCHRYLFNAGHAYSYAILAARMMYMKVHYPVSFYLALVQGEKDKNKRRTYIQEAAKSGIRILIPHINGSAGYSKVVVGGRLFIREGLINIDGIGPASAQAIVAEREKNGEYTSLDDAIKRLKGQASRLELLSHYGATDCDPDSYTEKCIQYNKSLIYAEQVDV